MSGLPLYNDACYPIDLSIFNNDAVADKFNAKGLFPLTLLINELGKVVKEWDGLPKETAEAFTQEVAAAIDKDKTAQ